MNENSHRTLTENAHFSLIFPSEFIETAHALSYRLMFDMSPNSPFNIVYELGDFWTDNDKLREECAYSLNSSWWRIAEDDPMETETKKSFMNSAWQSLPSNTTSVSAIMVMVIAIAVMALLRSCELRMRKKKVAELMDGDEAAYGAI